MCIYVYVCTYIYICVHINIYIYIYYAHLPSVRFEHSVCRRSLMTTYTYELYILYITHYIYTCTWK